MSYFKRDKKHEELIANWLDEYFYSKLERLQVASGRVEVTISENKIKEAQRRGIDMILRDTNGEIYYIDEKSQTTYLNNPLPTFAFEISYESNGVTKKGWLVDEDIKTTHYILVYPGSESIKTYRELKNVEDIDFAEIILIDKSRLMKELYKLGINEELLIESAKKISIENPKVSIENVPREFGRLVKSNQLTEKPVNLVIKRTILENIASAIWKVHKDRIYVIKTFNEHWLKG